MTLRRARSVSPTETSDSKRRSTVIEPCKEFIFCEDAISPVDTLFAYCDEEEENCDKARSNIYCLFIEKSVKFLEAEILKNQQPDFLDTAKLLMKDFLKLVEDNQPISGEDAEILLHGVWLNSCFVRSLGAAIAKDWVLMLNVMYCSNQDSVADRTAHMKEDPYFKNSLMGLKEPTSTSTFIRLFLSILIGHWCDEGLLRELDNKMGKNVFGRQIDMIAKSKARAIERAGKEDEYERFSFDIEDASDVKDLEPFRQLLVSTYGQRKDRDIEAILEKTKHDLSNLLRISQNYLGYNGKKTNIEVSLCNGRFCVVKKGPCKKVS